MLQSCSSWAASSSLLESLFSDSHSSVEAGNGGLGGSSLWKGISGSQPEGASQLSPILLGERLAFIQSYRCIDLFG